jgi:hypothetical protein
MLAKNAKSRSIPDYAECEMIARDAEGGVMARDTRGEMVRNIEWGSKSEYAKGRMMCEDAYNELEFSVLYCGLGKDE